MRLVHRFLRRLLLLVSLVLLRVRTVLPLLKNNYWMKVLIEMLTRRFVDFKQSCVGFHVSNFETHKFNLVDIVFGTAQEI